MRPSEVTRGAVYIAPTGTPPPTSGDMHGWELLGEAMEWTLDYIKRTRHVQPPPPYPVKNIAEQKRRRKL